MSKAFVGHKIIQLDSVDSTNNYALKELREGRIKSGAVVQAMVQTQGKGQRGKEWESEPYANLLVSIVADLNLWNIKNIISLNHITALAIQHFLSKHTSGAQIKWPNDIMINGKKIAGILIENQISSQRKTSVIGIGINIGQTSFPIDRATSLLLETSKNGQPKELVFELIDSYNKLLQDFQNKGADDFHKEFDKELWKLNEEHLFVTDEKEFMGRITSSTAKGQLVICVENEDKLFSNGEIKY